MALLLASLSITQSVSYNDLQPCTLSTHELESHDEPLRPCIAWYLAPPPTNASSLVTVIQVTPLQCANHRDGAPAAVELLNSENDDRGAAIGYNKDHYVQFRLVSVVVGNSNGDYDVEHQTILRSMIETLNPQYILGTCTLVAALEREIALEYKLILMAQVGPPLFYADRNPYVFGFHLNSDMYPKPAIQALRFHAEAAFKGGPAEQPLRIVYRTQSDFFRSTCQSVLDYANGFGFTDSISYMFDPFADDDSNGIVNSEDSDFLIQLADSVCPPGSPVDFSPAIFVCTLTEQDVLIERWKENGCRPVSMWMTEVTRSWATDSPESVLYIQGGAQWHPFFKYRDNHFSSGTDFLNQQEQKLGYRGTYDMVVSYSIITLFAQHIQWGNRVKDNPTVEEDFGSDVGYEKLRRNMLTLITTTLWGPFSLRVNDQQNSGRGTAGTQWLHDAEFNNSIENKCTSPLSEAEVAIDIPAPSVALCEPGSATSLSAAYDNLSLLSSKCELCPIDTYSRSIEATCEPCPPGSHTDGGVGATFCAATVDNILPRSLLAMAFVFVCIIWSLGISMLAWIVRHKDADIAKTSRNYLYLLTAGAMLSSSSIMAISFEVGTSSTATLATVGCQAAPFLYSVGWVLQLGSVAGLAYPVSRHAWQPHVYSYVEPKSPWPLYIALAIDLIVLTVWIVKSPLEYSRWTATENMDLETGIFTTDTLGFCSAGGDISTWAFLGPVAVCHGALFLRIVMLYIRNRKAEDRFGQRRDCLFAALYAAQLLLICVPLVVAVGENTTARYAAMCALVFCSDLGVVSIIFFPIRNRRKTCEEYNEDLNMSSKQLTAKKRTRRDDLRKNKGRRTKMEYLGDSYLSSVFGALAPEELSVPPTSEDACQRIRTIDEFDATDFCGPI